MTARTVYRFSLLLLLNGVIGKAWAQASSPLPLQPHKLKLAQQLYREGIAQNDSMKIAEGYYEYAKLYVAAADLVRAKQWFLKTLHILENRGDTYELARLYVRLGELAGQQLDYPECIKNAYKALAIAKRSRSDKALMRAYSVLSQIHERDWSSLNTTISKSQNWPGSNPDSALYYLHKCEYLAYRLNDPMEVAHVTHKIGIRLLARKDRQSLSYLVKAMTIANEQKNIDRLPMTLAVAKAYIEFGQPAKALPYIETVKRAYDTLSPTVNNRQHMESAYIHYYKAIGNWKAASEHIEASYSLEKNTLIADRDGAVSRLSVEYETAKKEALLMTQKQELALQTENQRVQNWFLWAVSALLLVAGGMSVVFYRLSRKNKRISLQNAELVREQNHRVKNNLQTMSNLLTLQANRLTDEVAKKAVAESQLRIETMALLQRQLYDGNQLARVDLAEFIPELVGMVLQAFGYADIEPVYVLSPTNVSADQAMPVALILNELTTNACKYAFADHSNPVFRVSCRQRDNQITLTVSDNGPGLHPPMEQGVMVKTRTSFGMKLIQTQVKQLRGISQFSDNEGTQFTLSFTA